MQTQQLIAGGRQPELRVARDARRRSQRLEERGWITSRGRATSWTRPIASCARVEHRLQMIADEQTQTLPDDPDKLAALARFCGFADTAALSPRA